MWAGVSINMMYSGSTVEPVIEKLRILYLRTNVAKVNGRVSHILSRQIAPKFPSTRRQAVVDFHDEGSPVLPDDYTFLGTVSMEDRAFLLKILFGGGNLFLCWNPRYLLQYRHDKAIDMESITNIQAGNGKWDKCILICSEKMTIVVKVEDDGLFQELTEGLWIIAASRASGRLGSPIVDAGHDVESSWTLPPVSTLSTRTMRQFPKERFTAVACPLLGGHFNLGMQCVSPTFIGLCTACALK
jgi:hypothetical protein